MLVFLLQLILLIGGSGFGQVPGPPAESRRFDAHSDLQRAVGPLRVQSDRDDASGEGMPIIDYLISQVFVYILFLVCGL